MKKSLFYLLFIGGLLSFTGCSNDDSFASDTTTTKSTTIRWYGVNNPSEEISTRGVSDKAKLWNQDAGIAIKFINNPSDAGMIDKIKTIAAEWENYAGIKFDFVNSDQNASVRIAFDWNGNDWLTWSYTGTDAKFVRTQTEPTAVFGGLQYLNETQFKGDVLRVFGQILGLEYEQRHQNWTFWRDEAKLQSYWEDNFQGMNMNWDEIKEYVFTPLTGENAIYPTQTTEIDELSVMAWPYYSNTQTTKLLANYELSEGDKTFIAQLYPKQNQNLPTIQEAWVDAGFFTWKNSDKTALKLTPMGAEQESLPDVSDGEQLTSVEGLFAASKLKNAPKLNTSNVTNFNAMFYNSTSLLTAPQYNTSKGTTFSYMFANCTSLTAVPPLNTAKGTNFSYMFSYCTSLTNVPTINTAKGIYFDYMFRKCTSLTTAPALDTANGTTFRSMFFDCSSLTTIPALNTANGLAFSEMFSYCSSLTSIPALNTAKGGDFTRMFYSCRTLQQKPSLSIPAGATTTDMYKNTPFGN